MYYNKRTECWGFIRDWLANGAQIPNDPELAVDLCAPGYDRRRLGHITKQGNSLLRFLLVEAAQAAVRRDPDWRRRYTHLAMRRDKRIRWHSAIVGRRHER